jgi:hypothetical protein
MQNENCRLKIFIAIPTIIFVLAGSASAITLDVPVTPAYLTQKPKEFSIRAEKGDDGLVHFTITRHLSEPRYLVARFTVREKGSVVLDGSFPAFAREKAAKYYLAVSPKQLSGAHFELSDHGIGTVNGTPVGEVGGEDYQIRLADFAPKASKTSGD